MENFSVLPKAEIKNQITNVILNEELTNRESIRTNPVLQNILSEGGDDFFQYLTSVGLEKEPNLMVLSSMHHYYYDHNDLKGIRTLVNIKKLNQIKHLESFLHTLFRIMPSKAYFVGCFRNSRSNGKVASIHQSAKFLNGLINIFDSKSERSLTKRGVSKLMETHGFKVNDLTDINGLTYFWAQNMRRPGE